MPTDIEEITISKGSYIAVIVFILVIFFCGVVVGNFWKKNGTVLSFTRAKQSLPNGGFVGWNMPCSYTHGSTDDSQEYLACANNLVYQKIGESPSTVYFDPSDTKVNEKYCKKGQVATFSVDDVFTKDMDEGNTFSDCLNW